MLEQLKICSCLVTGPIVHPQFIFRSTVPLKAVKKKNFHCEKNLNIAANLKPKSKNILDG
jgi:hypothetical protein